MRLVINGTMPKDLINLIRRSDSPRRSAVSVAGALVDTIFMAGIYEGEELIAFGRICGDRSIYFLICDIIVDRRYLGRRLDIKIFKELNDFLVAAMPKGAEAIVIARPPLGKICARFGYKYIDTDYLVPMRRKG